MKLRAFKYASPLIMCLLAVVSFSSRGFLTFLPVIWAYVLIPVAELFLKPDEKNMEQAEEEVAKSDAIYDYILYAIPISLYLLLFMFLSSLRQLDLQPVDYVGRIVSMGLLCGALGINVGHELGHRTDKYEQALAKLLLMSSLYMHFIIEHNKGHHKRVATMDDPNTARENETVFAFYIRSITQGYMHAWQIANAEVKKKGVAVFSWQNQMVRFTLYQFAFVVAIFFSFGIEITTGFLGAALLGILLLETVNYIEHYGLTRKQIAPKKFERPLPQHSWNSNHVLGRIMLFELSRHSDHHYLASRKYQVLRHHDQSPQLPTGYPGMMILSYIPPLFFSVMKKQMKKFNVA